MDNLKNNTELEIDVLAPEELKTTEVLKNSVREKIAMRLTYSVITISLVPIIGAVIFPDRSPAIRDVAVSIIPAVVGIYGTIIGFYFGDKR